MIEYWKINWSTMLIDLQQHAVMVLASLGIALVIAGAMILLLMHRKNWLNGLTYFFSLLYSVPSFAFFALLLPISGLGMRTAIIVLTIYCEYVLLRTFITGIQEIDPALIEVAKGMGMTRKQVFFKVQLPLATPAIFSGLQVALASTMGIATIAATINAGGLGQLLFEGLQSQQVVPILWGTLLTVVLTLLCAGILKLIEWLLIHRWRAVIG
ncbi:ABC transporter permease [Limosilactobacillus vaginalis]|jgi:osmoprotectant transport system permease protein|uniref:ABC transporter permease n=2 Tax=Limosilactobacillus vaginalis TaxID=1633 RepID=A0AAP3GFJ4_9LACO|nr:MULTISPECIES: ABC transporter permease [Limosilactobacillus]PEH05280.1 ABC transporter permease [Lactobacillus sp. UMNPBX5]EEJ40341.1 ABC transporter, permease protein [Limosilactobacillus vaginalis DSM 5837 = ATCC 49540]KRM48129.1 glycine betaine choline ABC superfamily ATP binding cassette transporter, membrane protein [Limosilactobacillus vaginalis DSM 5837 = ATCC 49540]MCI6853428.1 ABC transporter permease [Limosilactobacillus vaginalis]MCZ2466380.1 ABC transporter permease [Limosilacto